MNNTKKQISFKTIAIVLTIAVLFSFFCVQESTLNFANASTVTAPLIIGETETIYADLFSEDSPLSVRIKILNGGLDDPFALSGIIKQTGKPLISTGEAGWFYADISGLGELGFNFFTIVAWNEHGETQHNSHGHNYAYDTIISANESLKDLNEADYSLNGWLKVNELAYGLGAYIVSESPLSHEISRLKTALDDAVLGVFSLNMHIKNVPYSLSGIVNVNIPPSSLNVKKGDLITVFVDNVNLVQADLNAQYAFFKGYANMANATCFSLNLSVQDSQESPIALSGSADIKVQIPHTFNKKRYKPVKAEIYFRSAPTAVPVKLTSNLSQENDAWFISASTDSFGDFYILAEYEEIINPKGVIIRGRFYPWALLGWVIGAVGGVIAVSVALVLIISKRKVNKRGN